MPNCKFCGKEYKSEQFLEQHESKCNSNPANVGDEVTMENPVEHVIVSEEFIVEEVVKENSKKETSKYFLPRNYKTR